MRLYSYIVARDFGFAPNPFYGICTLATCKPKIRATARPGDWIVGTGSKGFRLDGHIVFAMRVTEVLTFDQYWSDTRFKRKRPNLRGSLKQAYGDNIYHRHPQTGDWLQEDSHHSYADGSSNPANVERDTQSDAVLIGEEFYYWGKSGPKIPNQFRNYNGLDVCLSGPGHKCNFPHVLAGLFVHWIRSQVDHGYLGEPAEF
ncbi:Nmad2 family putative nucleotide modification protein [Stratiformator vulcanicus]|uniref:Nmad2 family putative nucleotide modification protein n=1 Tax=Stratiformator vulcanicus TaxID=2527980 RepID=UPI00119E603C|nr:hypothetical protein [Stratiformator vulcanicus]